MPNETTIAGVNAVRQGSGPPLLLLHGIGHRWQMWTPLLDDLARTHDVVAVDLPGFGATPRARIDGDMTLDAAVTVLGEVLDELGWERAHLVGSSLGGWLSLELALRDRALSVCGLAPAGLWQEPDRLERRLRFWFSLWVGGSRRMGPAVGLLRFAPVRAVAMGGVFGRPWKVPPEVAMGDARNLATSAFDETFEAGAGLRFTGGRSLGVPVTVAWASRDPLFGERSCTVAELPDHTRVVHLRGCGHVPTWDDPSRVLATIRATVAAA